jgi:serine/threonine protein kinase
MSASDRVPLAVVLELPVTSTSTLHRYSVSKLIGEGGMGKVFLGYDHKLDREVAIKVLAEDDEASETKKANAARRFYREAKLLAALNHPNIIRLFDYSGAQSPRQFVVMELLSGRSLDAVMGDSAMSEPLVLAIIESVASALAEAHGKGLVHRDIKAENIMLEPNGRVVVLDFGLALGTQSEEETERATFVGARTAIVGTVKFASPEQLSGQPLSGSSDIFSLGATAHYLRSGVPPFTGASVMDVANAIKHNAPTPLTGSAAVSPKLGALLTAMLDKNPSNRPTAEAVATTASAILSSQGGRSAAAILSQAGKASSASKVIDTPETMSTARRRPSQETLQTVMLAPRANAKAHGKKAPPGVALVIVLLALIALTIWLVVTAPSEPTDAPLVEVQSAPPVAAPMPALPEPTE